MTNPRILFNFAMGEHCTSLWGLVYSSDSQTTSACLHWQFLRWPLEGKGASIIFWNAGDSQWSNCRCVQRAKAKRAGWTPARCRGCTHLLYLFLSAYLALVADGTMWCSASQSLKGMVKYSARTKNQHVPRCSFWYLMWSTTTSQHLKTGAFTSAGL